MSQLLLASRYCGTYPTDDKCAIIKPQLPLTLADIKPREQKGSGDGDERPGDDGHERSMVLIRVANPILVGSHLDWT
jgi:hypothetical protein